jgi:hypothetical protein
MLRDRDNGICLVCGERKALKVDSITEPAYKMVTCKLPGIVERMAGKKLKLAKMLERDLVT